MDNNMAIALAVLFGLLVGSFLNVVVYRLPIMLDRFWNHAAREQLHLTDDFIDTLSEDAAKALRQQISPKFNIQGTFNLLFPHSRCGHCGAPVRAWQNIPIISWLILRGKCHSCHAPISMRYPLVEGATALFFAVVAWQYGWGITTVFGCVLSAMMFALVLIDADEQFLPDDLTVPLFGLGLVFNWYTGFVSLEQAVLGALCGYLSLYSFYWIFKWITGKEGMGYGDFKMLAAIGAWVGLSVLPIVVLVSSLVGIVAAVVRGVKREQAMAFGPCLGIAGWGVFVFHQQVLMAMDWWLRHSGF